MSSIGIIANPASGKDIRRLVSYATTIDNQEKVNIVKRVVLAAQSLGVTTIWFMPDTFQIGRIVMDDLARDGRLTADCKVLDMPLTGSAEDTTTAALMMEEAGVGCCLVLGGDGTSRAAAKGLKETPLLPLSTGTNNVYPYMTEGTVAGMAAAVIACYGRNTNNCIRDKIIEISVNGKATDIALVDAVLTDDLWVGARAIWDTDKLKYVAVTKCHPAGIGFSTIVGCQTIITSEDDYGAIVKTNSQQNARENLHVPIAAGVIDSVCLDSFDRLNLDEPYVVDTTGDYMIALDGEREVRVRAGDKVAFTVKRTGPWRIKIRETLEEAVSMGIFKE